LYSTGIDNLTIKNTIFEDFNIKTNIPLIESNNLQLKYNFIFIIYLIIVKNEGFTNYFFFLYFLIMEYIIKIKYSKIKKVLTILPLLMLVQTMVIL